MQTLKPKLLPWKWHEKNESPLLPESDYILFECIDHGVLCCNRNAEITFANSTFLRNTGWQSKDLIGQKISEIISPEDHDLFRDGLSGLNSRTPQWKSELRILDAYSNIRDLEFEIVFRKQSNSFLILSRELVRVDDFASGSTKVFEMLENISDGFFCLDKNWKIIYMNKSAEKIALRERRELIGKHIWDEYPEMVNTFIHSKYIEAMQLGQPVRFEGYLPQFDAWFETNIFPSSEGLSIYFRDVTESKKQREAMNEYTERLKQTNDELEQFAHIASHDLKEPLRMISSFVHLLKQDYENQLGEDAKEFIHYITQGAGRLQQMINDLLTYSRSTRADNLKDSLDLNEIVSNVLNKYEQEISASKAKIRVGALPSIEGNASQLQMLIRNIIDNSLKFKSEDQAPEVDISCTTDQSQYVICISDNGIGFDMQYAGKIFQIFQKLHSRDVYPGSGIGLAIAKKIVERHAGKIWVESEKNKGSKFYLSFPLPLSKKQDFSDLSRKL